MSFGRAGRGVVIGLSAMTIAALAGCTVGSNGPAHVPGPGSSATASAVAEPVLADASIHRDLDAVVRRSVAAAPIMRLVAGLVPPTNRWFSGLVFGDKPQPVFPFPLSFALTESGFTAGLPVPNATANTIASATTAPVTADLGATEAVVSAYDEVAVTLEYRRDAHVLGHLTVAEGSPLVSYRAAAPATVRLSGDVVADGAGRGTLTVGGSTWAVVTAGATVSGSSVRIGEGGAVVLFPVPSGATRAQVHALMAAAAPITGVTTRYSAVEGGRRTELGYTSAAGSPTLVVPLPHQGQSASAGCTGLTYPTVYGTVPVCVSRTIPFTTPNVQAAAALDLSGVGDAERTELGAQLRQDVASSPAFAADTYFGGKSLYRSAMLLQLAHQVGDDRSAATLQRRLEDALDRWMDPKGCAERSTECFVYDGKLKSLVGLQVSFGSEQDNDHHFHYGYFLYAAAVVAEHDPAVVQRWAPVMNLLAADIASRPAAGSTQDFATTRVFDPYFSHSWASGYSPFADGNNQESSSEAVNAWTGLALWANVSKDQPLAAEAQWLLSAETASALAYWIDPHLSGGAFAAYTHPMVSLNWGAKRDFATWFSAEPNAIVGIQLIPMGPGSGYLGTAAAGGAKQIDALLAAAAPNGYRVSFGDYLLMYRALAGRDEAKAALTEARTLPAKSIDDGDSRTYLLAYLMSRASG